MYLPKNLMNVNMCVSMCVSVCVCVCVCVYNVYVGGGGACAIVHV